MPRLDRARVPPAPPPASQHDGGTQPASQAGRARERAERDRRLRGEIRDVAREAEADRDQMVDLTTDKLQQALTRLDGLKAQAVRPREHAEDADAFVVLASRGLESSRMLAAGGESRTPSALLLRVVAALGPSAPPDAPTQAAAPTLPLRPGDLDWGVLASAAAAAFRTATGASCALGPLDVAPRGRAVGARAGRDRGTPPPLVAPAVRDVGGGEGEDDAAAAAAAAAGPAQETDARMVALYTELLAAGDAGLRVVAAVLDHERFATTVENLFALSFLVRDGIVALADAPDGWRAIAVGRGVAPAVAAARAEAAGLEAVAGGGAAPTRQLVLAFDADDWQAWKTAVPPAECVMARHGELGGGGEGGGARGRVRAREEDGRGDGRAVRARRG